MRLVSIALNITLFFVVVFLSAASGWPRTLTLEDLLIMIVLLATPILTLATLWRWKDGGKSNSLLSLFLERKRLEEKTKIEKLKNGPAP